MPDIKTNVDLAFAQCPDARKMMVVIDDSEWGEFLYDQLQTIKRGYTHRRFYYLKSADYNSKQLLEKLKTLSKDVVVLWASWKQDKDGTVSSWKSVLVEASQVCPVPIYGIESSMLGNGIVGGKLLVIENQSQKAAKMVQQILAGASPKDIPIQNDSVTSYMFDYTQLTRWEINLSEIPPDSYVIHRPGFDFLSNQAIFWGASALLFIIAVACTLIISVRYRRHAETQWRRTEQRFSFIYEQSPLAYQSLDPKGRILSVNRAWSELLGYGANEAVGRKFAEFLAPDSKRVFLEYWDQCTEPDLGEIRIDLPSIEIKLVSHYGHVVPVLFYLRKAYDPIDRTTAFYSAMHDISQRREAEDTLRQEDIRLNSLLTLNQMLDSSIEDITDYAIRASLRLTESERGYLAFVNENEETLTLHAWGFERNGVYYVLNESKTLPSNTTGLWDGILEKREPILINDTHSPNPSWHRFGENSYLPGRRLCVPVFDKDRIVAVASVANKQQEYAEHDIQQLTLLLEGMWRIIERKKTTDKLHEYTNNLESANRQLEECSLAAQQASRAKSEFLANMSHEIRTPMTAIIGFTELLRTEGDITKAPPARIEAIDTVNRNANYLLFLLNDILDLSKIEAGHLQIETDNCELPGLINDVTKLMETRAIAKGLILDVDTAEDVPEAIYTDSYRLRQILLNLLGNAVKFTNQGMVRLVVSRKRQKAGEDRVFFEVIDTGIGISQDKMEQIFDPFTQADSSTSRQFGGTGLGLCISRKLARMLGGELYVESELDVGSIFTLAIPCISKVEERANDESFRHAVQTKCGLHDANQVEPTPQDMSDMLDCHVLVVDDGIDNRRLISAFLDRAG
ncbi:MAG: ABC transporter substrate binding protein, partial [Planctomycetia bacterium]